MFGAEVGAADLPLACRNEDPSLSRDQVRAHARARLFKDVKKSVFGVLLSGGAAEEPWNLWFRLSAPCRFFSPSFSFFISQWG